MDNFLYGDRLVRGKLSDAYTVTLKWSAEVVQPDGTAVPFTMAMFEEAMKALAGIEEGWDPAGDIDWESN